MFTWRPTVEECVLGAAREEGVRTFVVRSGIAYSRLLEGELLGGPLLWAVSEGPHRAREIAASPSLARGADGRIEA